MTRLVADVGGTNSRLALIDGDDRMSAPVRYANAGFGSFHEVLERFVADANPPNLRGCCVAVAGPVNADRARLTNRDWVFEPAEIAAVLPGGADLPVRLVNDLVALGYALPGLAAGQLTALRPVKNGRADNGQMLVAGMGTGFNVCAVKPLTGGRALVCEAELGHASLPSGVTADLAQALGAGAGRFETVEDLFSGRGLALLGAAVTGGAENGEQLLGAADRGDTAANRAVDLFARLLGRFTREMVFQYLPQRGIYLAGGVARGVLGSTARHAFLQAFGAPGAFAGMIAQVPVWLITDDAAALGGAATCAETRSGATPAQ